MKKILIVGAGSYVGENVRSYLQQFPPDYSVDILDAKGLKPEVWMFSGCDIVFYVAGIAHRRETKKNVHLYYEVNRDLAIAAAEKAKTAGVHQFIIMSTMAVYGLSEGVIGKNTKPKPTTHYGRSKLEADRAIWKMRDGRFRVAVLRTPMIYGAGCKGNYERLRTLSLHTPVFPKVQNQRSMLYIGNLNSFVKDVIDTESAGLFFPQNSEYVNTSEMVRQIAAMHGKHVRLVPGFNWIKHLPVKTVKKVFGSLVYKQTGSEGHHKDLAENIRAAEKPGKSLNLWIFHHYATTPDRNGYIRPHKFAKHLTEYNIKTTVFASSYHHWADENVISDKSPCLYEVSDDVPYIFVRTPSSAAGSAARIQNMLAFAMGLNHAGKAVEGITGKPDMILASSPHPFTMIAGILMAKKRSIPCICEIRDLWPEAIFMSGRIHKNSIIGRVLTAGEHWIYRKADALIFTKEGDIDYLKENGWLDTAGGVIRADKCFYINNGIDCSQYDKETVTGKIDDKDLDNDAFKVLYTGAIRPVNNVENILEAAKIIKQKVDEGQAAGNIRFLIYGDGNLRLHLEKRAAAEKIDNVVFKGYIDKRHIPYILSKSSVNLLNYSSKNYNWARGNSSNKLFEYMASGKPVISTVKTGYSIIKKYQCGSEIGSDDPKLLADEILKYFNMDREEMKKLGDNAKKGSKDFDYQILSDKLRNVIIKCRQQQERYEGVREAEERII